MRTGALTFVFVMALALAASPRATPAQQGGGNATPKEATITFQLEELPGRQSADSYWEVSYQLRIADQDAFLRWSEGGEDPNEQSKLGLLVSKNSFTRRDLTRPENRRVSIPVPLNGAVLERFRNAAERKQYVWMDGTVRIRDASRGKDLVMKLGPVWGPRRFTTGVYNVYLEAQPEGGLHMWSDNGKQGRTVVTRP